MKIHLSSIIVMICTGVAAQNCPRPDGFLKVNTPDTLICPGQSVQLSLTYPPGVTGISWGNPRNLDALEILNAAKDSATATPPRTVVYDISGTYQGCPLNARASINVVVLPPIWMTNKRTFCPGEEILLNTANRDTTSRYLWRSNDPSFTDTTKADPRVRPTGAVTYSVTVANVYGCPNRRSVSLRPVFADIAISATASMICAKEEVQLRATSTIPGGQFVWSPGPSGGSILRARPLATTTYTATYQLEGCFFAASLQVAIKDSFKLDIAANPGTRRLDIGSSVQLSAVVSKTDQNQAQFTYLWKDPSNKTIGTARTVNVKLASTDSVQVYTVIATAPNGCTRIDTIPFKVILPDVEAPNVFTPNDDNVNDVFRLVEKNGAKITAERFEIYNRWGAKIFESTDPNPSWDGVVAGEEAPSDIYLYRIVWRRADGAVQAPVFGQITLLR